MIATATRPPTLTENEIFTYYFTATRCDFKDRLSFDNFHDSTLINPKSAVALQLSCTVWEFRFVHAYAAIALDFKGSGFFLNTLAIVVFDVSYQKYLIKKNIQKNFNWQQVYIAQAYQNFRW